MAKKRKMPKIGRDTIIFATGLGGIYHELVVTDGERPTLLILFATMIGLPAFLRSDEKEDAAPVPPAPSTPLPPPPQPVRSTQPPPPPPPAISAEQEEIYRQAANPKPKPRKRSVR